MTLDLPRAASPGDRHLADLGRHRPHVITDRRFDGATSALGYAHSRRERPLLIAGIIPALDLADLMLAARGRHQRRLSAGLQRRRDGPDALAGEIAPPRRGPPRSAVVTSNDPICVPATATAFAARPRAVAPDPVGQSITDASANWTLAAGTELRLSITLRPPRRAGGSATARACAVAAARATVASATVDDGGDLGLDAPEVVHDPLTRDVGEVAPAPSSGGPRPAAGVGERADLRHARLLDVELPTAVPPDGRRYTMCCSSQPPPETGQSGRIAAANEVREPPASCGSAGCAARRDGTISKRSPPPGFEVVQPRGASSTRSRYLIVPVMRLV